MSGVYKIKLSGKTAEFLGAGDSDQWVLVVHNEKQPMTGAIATRSQLESFAMNPAHLCSDGVKSYEHIIGSRNDVQIGERIEK